MTGINVTDEEGTVLDAQPGGYTTPAIPVSELAPALLSLDGAYTEEAPDGDGDGLYEELRIKVLVDVAQPGYVTAIARLVDAHGREITWAEGSAYAAVVRMTAWCWYSPACSLPQTWRMDPIHCEI